MKYIPFERSRKQKIWKTKFDRLYRISFKRDSEDVAIRYVLSEPIIKSAFKNRNIKKMYLFRTQKGQNG